VSCPENIEEEIRNFYGIAYFPHVCEVVDIILLLILFIYFVYNAKFQLALVVAFTHTVEARLSGTMGGRPIPDDRNSG
jgi:hypothetical protein